MQYCNYEAVKILSPFFLFVNIPLFLKRLMILTGLLLCTSLSFSEIVTDSCETLVAGDTLTSNKGTQLTWQMTIARNNNPLPSSLPYYIQLRKGASLSLCTEAGLPKVDNGQLTRSSLTVVGVNALSEFKAESDNDLATAMVTVPPPGDCAWQEGTDFGDNSSRLFSGKGGFFVARYLPEVRATGPDDPDQTDVTRNESLAFFGNTKDSDPLISSGGGSSGLPFDPFGKKPGFHQRPGSDHQGHFTLELLPANLTGWFLDTPDSGDSDSTAGSPAAGSITVSFNPGNGQESVYFSISTEELNFLLRGDEESNPLFNVRRMIPWLQSRLSGRQLFLDQALDILGTEQWENKNTSLNREQHEIIQRLVRLALEQPDQHFSLSFELTELLSVFVQPHVDVNHQPEVGGRTVAGSDESASDQGATPTAKSPGSKKDAADAPKAGGKDDESLSDRTGQGGSGGGQPSQNELPTEPIGRGFASLYEMAMEMVRTHPDRVAYSHRASAGADYIHTTYQQLGDKIRKYIEILEGNGLSKGDRIALFLKPSADWSACLYAANALGIVVVAIDINSKQEWTYYIEDSKPQLCIMENAEQKNELSEMLNQDNDSPPTLVVSPGTNNQVTVEGIYHPLPSRVPEEEFVTTAYSDAIIFYTRGATKRLMGVVHTNRSILWNINALMGHHKLWEFERRHGTPVFASSLPWSNFFGIVGEMGLAMGLGASLSFVFDVETTLLEDLAVIKPNIMMREPKTRDDLYSVLQTKLEHVPMYQRILIGMANYLSDRRIGYSSSAVRATWSIPRLIDYFAYSGVRALLGGKLELVIIAGAQIYCEVSDFYRWAGLTAVEAHGTYEAGIITISGAGGENDIRPYSAGKAPGGVILTRNKPIQYEVGELLVHSPGLMREYLNNPEATAKVMVIMGFSEKFYRTGYQCKIDRGRLEIISRASDQPELNDIPDNARHRLRGRGK